MHYVYDVFISYSERDAEWANRLYSSLIARNISPKKIFLDKAMRAGVVWEPTMSAAVIQSRILVCLWSENAKQSNWVTDELAKFKLTLEDEALKQQHERSLIMVSLEGDNNAYSKYQWINHLKHAQSYAHGIARLDRNVWDRVVDEIHDEIIADSNFTPIMLVVLAMTRDRIDSLNFTTALPNSDTLASAVKKMGIITDVSLLDRLDPTMRLPDNGTLDVALQSMNVNTIATPTAPNAPPEIQIQLSNGDSLGEALKKLHIMTVDDLLDWVANNLGFVLPNKLTVEATLKQRFIKFPDDLEALMIKTALRQYYGVSSLNWRPFGSPTDEIRTIMNTVESQYNLWLTQKNSAEQPFRWAVVEDFWSNTPEARQVLDRLSREKSVIIVEPLSLYDDEVSDHFRDLYGSYGNDKALIMALAPFVLPTPTSVMRVLISHKARQIYNYFYEPMFTAGKAYAKCGPDVGDATDINRWLLHALKPQISAASSSDQRDGASFLSPVG